MAAELLFDFKRALILDFAPIARIGTFSRADLVFDQGRNLYICPGGAELTSTGNIDQGHIVYYRASKNDCSTCSLKPKCTTAIVRKITRDLNEDVRDSVRALANTEAFQQPRRERKKVEMGFAHMKRILRLDRLRLRGLSGVRDEVLLTATAQNLERLVKLLGRAPPPLVAASWRGRAAQGHRRKTHSPNSAAKSNRVLQCNQQLCGREVFAFDPGCSLIPGQWSSSPRASLPGPGFSPR